jgi:hypothetical protein
LRHALDSFWRKWCYRLVQADNKKQAIEAFVKELKQELATP